MIWFLLASLAFSAWLLVECKRLKEALAFYAVSSRYEKRYGSNECIIEKDHGRIARVALNRMEPKERMRW